MMPLWITPRWGYGFDGSPRPPANAGGYRNRVPLGRIQHGHPWQIADNGEIQDY
jgi:hypothetical protein